MFSIFFFLFRSNGKKEHLDENDFGHDYGIYFENATDMFTDMFKVLSQQFGGTLTMAFGRHLIIEDFTNMNQQMC